MAIKYNWQDLQKRMYNGHEVQKVMYNWNQIRPSVTPVVDDYLCFTANTGGSTIALNKTGNPTVVELEISYDKVDWIDYTIGDTLTLVNPWSKIYFRNKSETPTGFSIGYSSGYYKFSMSWSISANWDVDYLLCKNSTTTITSWYCFANLFLTCTALTTAPKLHATTLTRGCYTYMFASCTSLTAAPSLPATNLEEECYAYMFINCTALTTAPSLPAGETEEDCYFDMFYGCTELITIPSLPAGYLRDSCYVGMFLWCSKIKLSTTQTWEYQTPYRIPTTWTWWARANSRNNMFVNTWGTFTGTPDINTTYYTSNQVI